MNRSRDEAIQLGLQEICSPNKEQEVTVQVDDGEDEYGTFVTVAYDNFKSSKYYYE